MPHPRRRGSATDATTPGRLLTVLRRLQPRRPHLKGIFALLFLVLCATAWLAYEAMAAGRDAQARAEDTLANYASLAAHSARDGAQLMAFETWKRLFSPLVDATREDGSHDDVLARLDYSFYCGCPAEAVRGVFWYDAQADTLASPPGMLDAGALAAMRAAQPSHFLSNWGFSAVLLPDANRVALFTSHFRDDDVLIAMYGLVGDVSLLTPYFEWVDAPRPLLPHPELQGANLDVLRIVLRDGDDRVLHSRGVIASRPYSASVPLMAPFPPFTLSVEIDPAAADRLLFGGLPGSRVPLLLGVLLLTATLMSASVVLLRRESELARLRAEFVASVSHELRTPLAQIRMFGETLLLGRTRSDMERRKALEIIDQEAKRLAHLVENVLLFARAERRRMTVVREPLPLGAEIEGAIDSFLPMCRACNVRVRRELERGVIAPVDRFALRQILINLMDNALKYGPNGQELTVGMAIFEEHVQIWVDDEGPGIPRTSRERIFEPFYRVEGASERGIAGSGIGLSVVRELAELHGGRAWADSAPGGGSRISVEFPGAYIAPETPGPSVGAVA